MSTTQETGTKGEEAAARYLSTKNYDVLERNARFGRYEIDIVAYDKIEKIMVFVEVKTRATHSVAYPIHSALNYRKRRAMRRAISHWVMRHRYDGVARIDLLSVCHGMIVEHLKDLGSDFV